MAQNYQKLTKYMFWSALLIIIILALTPGDQAMDTGFSDKINHLAAFCVLCILGCQAYPKKYAWIVAGLLLYGIVIEIGQLWAPGRSCSILDLAADTCGITGGICINTCFNFVRRRFTEV